MKTNSSTKQRDKMLLAYTKKVKWIFLGGLLFTSIAVGADLLGPYMVSRILDKELLQGVGPKDLSRFMRDIAIYGLSILASGGCRFVGMVYFQKTANKISMAMQRDIFHRIQQFPVSYFDSLPAGKIVSRITTDTKDVKVLYQVVLAQFLNTAIYTVGVYGALIALDINLFFMALIPLPVLALVVYDYRRKSSTYNRRYRAAISDLNGYLNESIQGMEIIQAFNREQDTFDAFDQVNQAIYTQGMAMVKLESYSSFNVTSTLQYITVALILLYFGYGTITGAYAVSIGVTYIFVDYMMKLFNQVQNAFQRLGELERANSAADNILAILSKDVEKEGEKATSPRGFGITFKEVSFSYTPGEQVLKEISFTIEEGKTAAFVGHTGSGKSTLMNLLLRYYTAEKGQVYIGDENIEEFTLRATREKMAIILQDPVLFSGSLYDNITLYDESITTDRALKALEAVGGKAMVDALPDGINTVLTERGASLSAGERQLVSFARAFVRDPKILVLDEATSNIDSQTESVIQKGMERLAKGRTTLIIAHRLSTIRHADQIFLLSNGKIIERGTHDTLIEHRGQYYHMYRSQSKGH